MKKMERHLPRLATTVLATSLLFVTAGCSSDGNDASDGGDAAINSGDLTLAKVDAATLGVEMELWYAENSDAPVITLEDDVYTIGDYSWDASLLGATLVTDFPGAGQWCVAVVSADSSTAASYSAERGMEESNTCG